MIDYQGEKLKIYLSKNKIKAADLASKLGISRVAVYKYFESVNLEKKTVNNIVNALNISAKQIWGDDKGRDLEFKSPRIEAKPIGLHDPDGYGDTGSKTYELPDGTRIMNVKLVKQKAYAGFLRGFGDPEYIEDLPTLRVIVDHEARGDYLAFEADGDSMTPSRIEDIPYAVLPGWRVIGRIVKKHLWQYQLHTSNTSKWVIVHKEEGILIKQIIAHDVDNGVITIHSLNELYKDQDLHLDDIEMILNVVKTEINDR